jgi:hypothetical protein
VYASYTVTFTPTADGGTADAEIVLDLRADQIQRAPGSGSGAPTSRRKKLPISSPDAGVLPYVT